MFIFILFVLTCLLFYYDYFATGLYLDRIGTRFIYEAEPDSAGFIKDGRIDWISAFFSGTPFPQLFFPDSVY